MLSHSWIGKGKFFLHIYVSFSLITLWLFANFLGGQCIASYNIFCIYRLFVKPCQCNVPLIGACRSNEEEES